jgi:hypothetical protein
LLFVPGVALKKNELVASPVPPFHISKPASTKMRKSEGSTLPHSLVKGGDSGEWQHYCRGKNLKIVAAREKKSIPFWFQ